MDDNQRATLMRELYNYTRYREQIRECAYDLYYSGLTQDYSGIRGGSGGNGVENRIISKLSENERKALWVRVFEFTHIAYSHLDGEEDKSKFLELKFINRLTHEEISKTLYISVHTCSNWLNDILKTAYGWAKHFNLL
ncbi:MAG: hypothetical protein ACI4MN_05930 [Candidatus Coproplasma sp.]